MKKPNMKGPPYPQREAFVYVMKNLNCHCLQSPVYALLEGKVDVSLFKIRKKNENSPN